MELQGTLITPDFTQSPDQVSEGIYRVRIKQAVVKPDAWTTKDGTKVTQIAWELETFGEGETKNNGRRVFHRTDANGPFANGLKRFYLSAMGEELGGSFDYTMLYGREIEITVGPQKNKPEYMEVKAIRSISH